MTVQWTVRAAEPTEQGWARGETITRRRRISRAKRISQIPKGIYFVAECPVEHSATGAFLIDFSG